MARSRLLHHALVYNSSAEFVAVVEPLLREGMERGDALFVATKRSNIDRLRAALGGDAALVELHDTDTWQARPADRLVAVRRMIDGLAPGRHLLAFGEPVWSGSSAVRREWARYESVINSALADAPLRFFCLYDGSALPDEIVEHGLCTHSHVLESGATRESREFVAPERFVPSLHGADAEVPADVEEIDFDGDHSSFRLALGALVRERGVDHERAEELVVAANEISTNALRHGAPPISTRLWTTGDELVCEIADSGAGIDDPLAGWTLPDREHLTPGGWGLPLSRRLCDALEIVRSDSGNSVYLYLALAGERNGAAA
jgi:anti-sigma regulatory factor (Ser/Thr protein kinase)